MVPKPAKHNDQDLTQALKGHVHLQARYDALCNISRLLARQAAREHFKKTESEGNGHEQAADDA